MRPRLLDLFCGAGGAAMGYHRAGFEVVGVDIEPQPNYPFEFEQRDALELLSTWTPSVNGWWDVPGFDAIHASPPCQAYSVTKHLARHDHPDLIGAVRTLLDLTGRPYVVENVPGAPLITPTVLCGSSFGLDVRRHRLFETNWPLMGPPCVHGWQTPRFATQLSETRAKQQRRKGLATVVSVAGHETNFYKASVVQVWGLGSGKGGVDLWREAMGIDWMRTRAELAQAIPPAYTELIGHQLAAYLKAAAA